MTGLGKHILEDFESLADGDKIEVLSNLLRISRGIDYPQLTDRELLGSAEGVFLEYDRLENPD